MNASLRNYISWLVVIGFLVVPPFLVRTIGAGPSVRLISYYLLALAITLFFGHYIFSRTPLTRRSVFEKMSAQSRKNVDYILRGFCVLATGAGVWMLLSITPSVFTYINDASSVNSEDHLIRRIDSAAVPGAFYIRMGIDTEDGKYLSYMYPDEVLQSGGKYTFTLLPSSNFVLTAQRVE